MLLDNEYDKLYHTKRFTLIKGLKGTLRMIVHVVDGLILSKLFVKTHELNEIKIGSGKATRYKNINVLVYRESKNKFIFLENKCTHMGCSLIWNDTDKLWESKCHGSIFDRYGRVIYGPAIKNLKRLDII